ncbi:hypothetical protein Tco_0754971 [Tanacetum coccineum]
MSSLGLAAEMLQSIVNFSLADRRWLIPGPKSPGKDIDFLLRPTSLDVATKEFKVAHTKEEVTVEINGEIEDGDPPRKLTRNQIQAQQLQDMPRVVNGKKVKYKVKQSAEGSIADGYVGREALTLPVLIIAEYVARGHGVTVAVDPKPTGLNEDLLMKRPVPIRFFEWTYKDHECLTLYHASHWSNYLGELIREMPLYYPSWQKVPAERKAAIVTKIGFDIKPHLNPTMQDSMRIHPTTFAKIVQYQQGFPQGSALGYKPRDRTYEVESIRQRRPENITLADWDAQLAFWNDPRNQA